MGDIRWWNVNITTKNIMKWRANERTILGAKKMSGMVYVQPWHLSPSMISRTSDLPCRALVSLLGEQPVLLLKTVVPPFLAMAKCWLLLIPGTIKVLTTSSNNFLSSWESCIPWVLEVEFKGMRCFVLEWKSTVFWVGDRKGRGFKAGSLRLFKMIKWCTKVINLRMYWFVFSLSA